MNVSNQELICSYCNKEILDFFSVATTRANKYFYHLDCSMKGLESFKINPDIKNKYPYQFIFGTLSGEHLKSKKVTKKLAHGLVIDKEDKWKRVELLDPNKSFGDYFAEFIKNTR